MKRRSLFALLLLAPLVASAQDNPAKKFAGTWEARFNGAVFSILKIEAGEKISGAFSPGNIDVDEQGNLRSATATGAEAPILRPSVEEGVLRFDWSGDPNDEPLRLELKLTGASQAELRFLKTPGDLKINPLSFTRRQEQ